MHKHQRQESLTEIIRRTKERLGPPVAYRYRIEEYRPAHSTYGYDGQDHDDELVEATIWFDDEDLARALLEVTIAGPGNELRLRTQTGYDRVDRIWI